MPIKAVKKMSNTKYRLVLRNGKQLTIKLEK